MNKTARKLFALLALFVCNFALAAPINVMTFGAKGDGTTDDYTHIMQAYSAALGSSRVLCFPAALTFKTNTTISYTDAIKFTTCEGNSAFGYGSEYVNSKAARIKAGASMTNVLNLIASEGVTYTNGARIEGLVIDGNSLAARCINLAGQNTVIDVTTTGCTDAGLRLGDLTNGTVIQRFTSVFNSGGNGYGLWVQGGSTTAYSAYDMRLRQNTIGARIEGGDGVTWGGTNIVEANAAEGIQWYRPTTGVIGYYDIHGLWMEANGTTNYQMTFDSQTHDIAHEAGFIQFHASTINPTGSQKGVNFIAGHHIKMIDTSLSTAAAASMDAGASSNYIGLINGGAFNTNTGNRNYTCHDGAGSLEIGGPACDGVNATVFNGTTAEVVEVLQSKDLYSSATSGTLASGATFAPPINSSMASGLLFTREETTGTWALFGFSTDGATTLIASTGSVFAATSTPSGSQIGVYITGGVLTIKNGIAGNRVVGYTIIGNA